MKLNKFFYLNILLFLLVIAGVFGVGFFVIQKMSTLPAAAEEVEEAEEDTVPPAIMNVNISNISATSSEITWETDEAADSLIDYGLDKSYGVIRDPRADKFKHTILLENLEQNRQYFFRITSSDATGNQGISNDFNFTTSKIEKELISEVPSENIIEAGEGGLKDLIIEEGVGGLSQRGEEVLLKLVESISSEKVLEEVQEKVQEKSQEIVKPPTIILDYADVEVGTDYAIITWETDKESNTIAALAEESEYDASADNPYAWKEGEPDEFVLEHRVEVNGLKPATIYHFQVSSESSLGLKGISGDKTFKTKSVLPEIYNIQIIKIEEESATIRWVTNVPCSSIVEYTNLNSNDTKLEGNSSFLTVHSMKLTNLIFDTYYSAIIRVESEEGEKAVSDPLTFITTKDEFPPIISKVKTESTLYPGSDNKVQTIASWETDEPSKCQLFYHQGLVTIDEPSSLPLENDLAARHVQVVTNFIPSTVYKFWIICADEAENKAKSEDFTMLTPSQEESIIDIILKNFESSFGWVKKLKI